MATSVQPKDKTVNVNGINLHYLDWGTEGKPKVLLLHGLRGIATHGTTFPPIYVRTTM